MEQEFAERLAAAAGTPLTVRNRPFFEALVAWRENSKTPKDAKGHDANLKTEIDRLVG